MVMLPFLRYQVKVWGQMTMHRVIDGAGEPYVHHRGQLEGHRV
jgi:hypothetical protein